MEKEFGLPTTMTMEAIGIKSYNTYSKTFNELVEFGFFNLIEKSTNQYSANIIALSNFNKALDKALDKAFIKHATKQSECIQQSISSIDKPINNKQINKEQENNAFNFLISNPTSKLETFIMQNKPNVNDWNMMIDSYNDQIDLEIAQNKISFNVDELLPRLKKWCRSWISNQKKGPHQTKANDFIVNKDGSKILKGII